MHQWASSKDNFHPPYLIHSTEGEMSMAVEETSNEIRPLDSPSVLSSMSNEQTAIIDTPRSSSENLRNSNSRRRCSRSDPDQSTNRRSRRKRNVPDAFLEQASRMNRKTGKQLGDLMSVFAQMVKTDYPHIDVTSLIVDESFSSDEEMF
jgi:hypothetical protein